MKKKNNSTPKRKRSNKSQRISMAKSWLETYNGKNIVKGYSNWFGVDLLCAITELRLTGVEISLEYEKQVRKSHEDKINQRELKKESSKIDQFHFDNFESELDFIVGYTSNGFPFGITKEEANSQVKD